VALPALLAAALLELELSVDAEDGALLRRLRNRTYTDQDVSRVADMIAAHLPAGMSEAVASAARYRPKP
jgi:hypothetical protein